MCPATRWMTAFSGALAGGRKSTAKFRPERGPESPSTQVHLGLCAPTWEGRMLGFWGLSDGPGRSSWWSPGQWVWCPLLCDPVQLLNAHWTCSAQSHCFLIRQLALCWRWPLPDALIATGALQKSPEPWGKTGQKRAAEHVL